MHMPNRLAAGLLLGGLALASTMAGAAEPQSAGDCFLAAFKASDADAVAACYAEDGIIWFPGGPMARGREAIRDGFAGFFAHMTATGDTRTTWGTYVFTMVDKATQAETTERGRYVDVQKLIDGKWLYVVDHPSDDPPPAAE
jgi:uncharacterized protein (TIGR02246 family)